MKTIEIKESKNLQEFFSELKLYLTDDVNTIITNGIIGTVMQDFLEFELKCTNILDFSNLDFSLGYEVGKFDGKTLKINPTMRWDDNRIILKNDEEVIEEIEVVGDINFI